MAKAANAPNARAKAAHGAALRERAATKGGAAATKGAQGGVPTAAEWFGTKQATPAAKEQVGAVATWRPPRSADSSNKAKLLHAAASETKRKAAAKAKALAEAKAAAASK